MKTKYAEQIRRGVMRAKFEVGFTKEFGRPPYSLYTPVTELEGRAFDRTVKRLVANEVIAVGKSLLTKVKGFIDDQDEAVQLTKSAIEAVQEAKKGL